MLVLHRPFREPPVITQPFGPTGYDLEPPYLGYPHFHRGVDYALPKYTALFAPAAGRVIENRWDHTGYGWTVSVDHGFGIASRLAHLAVQSAVAVGTVVDRGTLLGYVGSTGNSTGPHLHWEVDSYGAPVHPAAFVPDEELVR